MTGRHGFIRYLYCNSTDKILQKYKRFRESCYLNLHLAQIEVHFSVTCVGWLSTIDMLFHAPKSVQHYIILSRIDC